jgi:hypothetical protein
MLQFSQRLLLLVALFLSLPSFALAQSAEDKALRGYSLDMAKLTKYAAVHEKMAAMVVANPSLASKYEGQESRDDQSLDDMVKDLDKIPELASAIRSQGMTMRDYVMTTLVLLQVGLYREVKKLNPRTDMPANINPANVTFMDTHAAEIQKLEARVKAAQEKIDALSNKSKR